MSLSQSNIGTENCITCVGFKTLKINKRKALNKTFISRNTQCLGKQNESENEEMWMNGS